MIEYQLTSIDRHFADFIKAAATADTAVLWVLTAILSNGVGSGDTCLDLKQVAGKEIKIGDVVTPIPVFDELSSLLQKSAVVGTKADCRPLILDPTGRLYLYRYWHYEHGLAQTLLDKGSSIATYDAVVVKDGLERLFPAKMGTQIDWQQVATLAAIRKKFCVISGGPGTGKTSTVVKIIALLLEQPTKHPLRIALAAPTGKSAARLKESISQMVGQLNCSATIKGQIPTDVLTIHRLLGYISGSVQFRHNQENQLPYDVVIIDEASMVPLTLMAKLVAALKPAARFILLGDKNQLASVDAGAVLGAICGSHKTEPFSTSFNQLVNSMQSGDKVSLPVSPDPIPILVDTQIILKLNYRFGDTSGIDALSKAINCGDGTEALSLLDNQAFGDVNWQQASAPTKLPHQLTKLVISGYEKYLTATTVAESLAFFDQFRILCPLRQGDYGVDSINALVEKILVNAGLINLQQRWYHGRPVMVTVNDYNLQLFNGDIGIVRQESETSTTQRVFFPAANGELRSIPVTRLPAHETVYAMTVHESQGSEFERLLLLLPNYDSEKLTRELLYTAVTRAKLQVNIWGERRSFVAATARQINRSSGLEDALWRMP